VARLDTVAGFDSCWIRITLELVSFSLHFWSIFVGLVRFIYKTSFYSVIDDKDDEDVRDIARKVVR
jgi:hypothetical protein